MLKTTLIREWLDVSLNGCSISRGDDISIRIDITSEDNPTLDGTTATLTVSYFDALVLPAISKTTAAGTLVIESMTDSALSLKTEILAAAIAALPARTVALEYKLTATLGGATSPVTTLAVGKFYSVV